MYMSRKIIILIIIIIIIIIKKPARRPGRRGPSALAHGGGWLWFPAGAAPR